MPTAISQLFNAFRASAGGRGMASGMGTALLLIILAMIVIPLAPFVLGAQYFQTTCCGAACQTAMLNATGSRLGLPPCEQPGAARTGASMQVVTPVRWMTSGIATVRTDGDINLPCPLWGFMQRAIVVRASGVSDQPCLNRRCPRAKQPPGRGLAPT